MLLQGIAVSMQKQNFFYAACLLLLFPATSAFAENSVLGFVNIPSLDDKATASHDAVPMGIIGADAPGKNKLALKIMPIFANYAGQLIGSKGVSSQFVVLTTPTYSNPREMMRVVPQDVQVSAQNAIVSYGITDRITAIITASMIQKQLSALTFFGETSGVPLGASNTGTKGFSDLTTSLAYKVHDDGTYRVLISSGFAYPLSSDTQNIQLLQSNGAYSNERAFYSLQPGSRTLDYLPGIVSVAHYADWSWGLSYRGRIPLASNPQGWRFGDLHEFNGWVGYNFGANVTSTLRLCNTLQGAIRGNDPQISGASVPTNPNYYGGFMTEIFGGIGLDGSMIGHREISLEMEAGLPLYQDLNGPQIRKNWQSGMALKFKM